MKIEEAEQYLKNKIGENSTDIAQVWEEFKAFGKKEIDGEEEVALLFQCGVYNFTGEKLFYYDFVRQFTNEDGEMEQLHCEFVFEPTKELKKLKAEKWYFDYEGDIEDFYKKIENLKEFKIPSTHKALRLDVYQEAI
jgi:hypothetical protein